MKRGKLKVIAINLLDTTTRVIRPVPQPVHGWLHAVRTALGLSRAAMAKPLGVSPTAIQSYEKNEKADTITVGTLRHAAAALGCELVVALVPRDGRTFADLATDHDPDLVGVLQCQ